MPVLVRLSKAAWKELPTTLPALFKDGWSGLLLDGRRDRSVPHVLRVVLPRAERVQVLTVGQVLTMCHRAHVPRVPEMRSRSMSLM